MEDIGHPTPEMYDEHESLYIPNSAEMHREVTDLVAASGIKPKRWLDTGCGTGTTVELARVRFPDTEYILADPDTAMLDRCKDRFGPGPDCIESKTHALTLPDGSMNVISAIMSHHYYSRSGREAATANCYRMLSENGLYITFEHCLPPDEDGVKITMGRWRYYLMDKGIEEERADALLEEYRACVFPITIESHLALLRKCGFEKVGVFWRSYTVTGFYAYKTLKPQ